MVCKWVKTNQKDVWMKKIKRITDMDLVLENFFKSVWAYINKMSDKGHVSAKYAHDAVIQRQELMVLEDMLTQLPRLVDDKAVSALADEINFMPWPSAIFVNQKNGDNRVELAFRRVILNIAYYYRFPTYGADKVLVSLKNWYYVTSNNVAKGIVYPFLPLSYFMNKRVK